MAIRNKIEVRKRFEFGSADEIRNFEISRGRINALKGNLENLKKKLMYSNNLDYANTNLSLLFTYVSNLKDNLFPIVENLKIDSEDDDSRRELNEKIDETLEELKEIKTFAKVKSTASFKKLDELIGELLDLNIRDTDIDQYQNTKLSLMQDFLILKENALSDVQNIWDKTSPNNAKGKKEELIKYLKLLYFFDENYVLDKKNLAIMNLDINKNTKSIFQTLQSLEKVENPKVFKKHVDEWNIDSVADTAIKTYKEKINSFNDLNGELDIIITNHNDNVANPLLKNNAIKAFKEISKNNKKSWVQSVYDLCLSPGIKKINGTKINIKNLGLIYDDYLKIDENGVIATEDLSRDTLHAIKREFNKILLGQALPESLLTATFENNQPELDFVQKSALIAKLNEEGEDFVPNIEFLNDKNIFKYNGEKSTFKELNNIDVVIRNEDNTGDIKVLYMSNSVKCDVNALMKSDSIRGSDVKIYTNDKDGNALKTCEIKRSAKGGDVYHFSKEAFENNLVMRLDNFIASKKGGVRIGLIEVQEKDKDGKLMTNPNGTAIIKLSLGFIVEDQQNANKNITKIKEQYGDRKFAGPDGVEMTINEIIDAGLASQKDLPQKTQKEESLYGHRLRQVGEDFKDGLKSRKDEVKLGFIDAKDSIGKTGKNVSLYSKALLKTLKNVFSNER